MRPRSTASFLWSVTTWYANDIIRLKYKAPHAPCDSLEVLHTKALGKGLPERRKTKIRIMLPLLVLWKQVIGNSLPEE
jgi:hypothetical protein